MIQLLRINRPFCWTGQHRKLVCNVPGFAGFNLNQHTIQTAVTQITLINNFRIQLPMDDQQPPRYQPKTQQYHVFEQDGWESVQPGSCEGIAALISFSILSWNIDFTRPLTDVRMKVALAHLKTLYRREAKPSILMLNECLDSDLELIKGEDWIRQTYAITDVSSEHWTHHYGTCILVPKFMPIKAVFRVPYKKTAMGRDALFVDIALPQDKTLRICSTHLESFVRNPPWRTSQLTTAAHFMHQADASVLGGDLNAIEDFDKTLHIDNGLKDAYLENGGEEGAPEGMTWGQMAATSSREMFGLTRMDKILYCGGVEVEDFETFGMDVVLEGEDAEELMKETALGLEKAWVTDHLGVRANLRVVW
ncbi:Endonuclease/exonuclease/phosphatase [Lasiosphaeris hirsuta]|uniref:Endonuclease/exonuclease/phosphatase n=1 Tax=Lasiosphaeris hirsuta TaxID=260670 RepID=A0AA40DMF4_9PEZI|nr:Endonuclease/exonuclease/phosphatase [Lasiosphaeris hirsuta]